MLPKRDERLVLPDATQYARIAARPLVTGAPRIRFYTGVALRPAAGEALGNVCVLEDTPEQICTRNSGTRRR